jgi:hypothetical protein
MKKSEKETEKGDAKIGDCFRKRNRFTLKTAI